MRMEGRVMSPINGKQLYGLRRLMATLRIAKHPELRGLSLRHKLALNYVSKQSKLTELSGKIYTNTFTPYFPSLAYDRYLRGINATIAGKPVPVGTNFAVTAKCPCNCWHCSFANRPKQKELSLEQLKQAISEVQELGTSFIGITGGEPLLRADLEEIIHSIDERSMPLLFTTGYNLTIERVRDLKRAGLEIPVISLDHYRPEIHDRGRRKKGMFDHAIRAIEMFKEEGFYVAVSFVPDRELVENREEIFKTIDFFRDLGVNDMRLTSPILSGKLANRREDLLTEENVKTIFEIQRKCTRMEGYPGVFAYDYFESKQFYGCVAGFNYMFIDSQGSVSPCDFTMLSLGNIKERSINGIWQEMNKRFCLPGCTCYANRISERVVERSPEIWPLDEKTSREIIEECPPFTVDDMPGFYKRVGLNRKKP
jgi:MoaA/NifB/PqqE/SkfB family radical SAM enzyme